MRESLVTLVFLLFVAVTQLSCQHHIGVKPVPPGFEYPEYGLTIQYKKELLVCKAAGTVLSPNGKPLDEVLVEIKAIDTGTRIAAIFTDARGNFKFDGLKEGKYGIKLTKPFFAPIRGIIQVAKSGQDSITFTLEVAN
jgi:hypothetical protein